MRVNDFIFTLLSNNVPMDKADIVSLKREVGDRYDGFVDPANTSFIAKFVRGILEDPYFRLFLACMYPFANRRIKAIQEDRPEIEEDLEDFEEDEED